MGSKSDFGDEEESGRAVGWSPAWHTFSVRGRLVNVLGSVVPKVSIARVQSCRHRVEAATDNRETDEWGRVLVKLLSLKCSRSVWPSGCGLPAPGLECDGLEEGFQMGLSKKPWESTDHRKGWSREAKETPCGGRRSWAYWSTGMVKTGVTWTGGTKQEVMGDRGRASVHGPSGSRLW